PRLLGRPAAGFEVAQTTSEPVEVRIAGPRSRVDEVESAFTEPISVEGARGPLTQEVNIGLEDPRLRVQGSPRVRVEVGVNEVRVQRTLEKVPVEVLGSPATVKPSEVSIVLAGPPSEVGLLSAKDVRAFVEPDVPDSQDGTATVRVEVRPGH